MIRSYVLYTHEKVLKKYNKKYQAPGKQCCKVFK